MIAKSNANLAYAKVHKREDRDYYGTPAYIVDRARKVMGSIQLDPASCEDANTRFIHADEYFDKHTDGLTQDWEGTVWMNPPYSGKLNFQFCSKLASEYEAGRIEQAVVLVNSATGTRAFRKLIKSSSAVCFLSKRINFIDPTGGRSMGANTKEQAIYYIGRRVRRFARVFGELGIVLSTELLGGEVEQ